MKKHLLLSLMALGLAACEKTDVGHSREPIVAPFSQDFSLLYQQVASLDASNQPELVVALTDVQHSICPLSATCVAADFVAPTLTITSNSGQTQQVTFSRSTPRTPNANFIDSTSIRANGRRYLLYYRKWHVPTLPMGQIPQKKDISVTLQVMR